LNGDCQVGIVAIDTSIAKRRRTPLGETGLGKRTPKDCGETIVDP